MTSMRNLGLRRLSIAPLVAAFWLFPNRDAVN